MIVVDAGVWVRSLVDDGPAGRASRRVLAGDPAWIAPTHAPIEVLRTIRRYETAGIVTSEQADAFVSEIIDAEVRYVGPERWLLESVWRHRHNISPYDAPYVALAEHYDVALVTMDVRLGRAAAAVGVEVILPGR